MDIMPHGATILLKPENVRHEIMSDSGYSTSTTPFVPEDGDCTVPGMLTLGECVREVVEYNPNSHDPEHD